MDGPRKVRILTNDGKSPLIQIEDDFGDCWIRRSRVHLVGTEYFITSERHASIMRGVLARKEARAAKQAAQQELDRARDLKSEFAA